MTQLKVIFDGSIIPSQITETIPFRNAEFVLIDVISPTLAENEGIEIGLALLMRIPVIEKTVIKYIPFRISEFEIGLIGDSTELIAIPREFSESEYEMFIGINLAIEATLRIYVITSNTTKELIQDTCDEINNKLTAVETRQNLQLTADVVQTGQLTAISSGLTIVATGLIPVTGGVSSPAVPIFGGASLPALLPAL